MINGVGLQPEFTWSISRQRMLERCPRQYYYRDYPFWGGWRWDAPEDSRLAYRLSKRTSLDALVGQEMDVRAREIEECTRDGSPLPGTRELEERTRRALRQAWRSSQDREGFEARPGEVTMLRSLYLEGASPDAEVARSNEKLPLCTKNLLAVPHWQRVASCGGDGCVPIADFSHIFVNEVRIYTGRTSPTDFAYVHEGTLYVVDWKTGRPGDDDETQVTLSVFGLLRRGSSLAALPSKLASTTY